MRSGVRTSQRIIRFGLTLLLCALAVQAPGASAQGIDDNASDAGHELPPAERQALLDAQASPPNAPQGNAVGDCDIGQWTPVEPINTARSRSGLAYAGYNGRFYLVGGESTGGNRDLPIEEYNPADGQWTDMAHLTFGVSNAGVAAIGQYIYIPGGYTGTAGIAAMQRYDIVGNSLTAMAPMTSPVYAHAVVAFGNYVIVLGGSETGAAGVTHRIYDVAGNSWSAGPDLPVAVQYPAAATDGTYLYVLGGNTTNLDTVQRYNPLTGDWTLISTLGEGRGGPGAFFDGVNVWVVGGGWTSYTVSTEYWNGIEWQSGPAMGTGARTMGAAFGGGMALKAGGWNAGYEDDAETLDVDCPEIPPPDCAYGNWQAANPLHTARSRTALVFAPANGRFYLLGGEATGGNRDLPIEEYNPASGEWTDRAHLSTGVSNIGAGALDRYIYVPGGYTGSIGITATQRYDVLSDTVSLRAPMPDANYAHAVVVHQDRLHVLGGSATGAAGSTHYIYDIAGDTWDTGAPLPTAVQYPTAASDGDYVYVLGGNTTNLMTVQRYDPGTDTWDPAPIMFQGRGGAGAFFDGYSVWAVGGGWASYLTGTEYFDGHVWRAGPDLNAGTRTPGTAHGAGIALKAGGWNGGYMDEVELMTLACDWPIFLPTIFESGP